MAKSVSTGWRIVTPGLCDCCGLDTDYGFEGGGSVQCSCQIDPKDLWRWDFTEAKPTQTDNLHQDGYEAALAHDPRSPGKFEGEDRATVYYYQVRQDMNGLIDHSGNNWDAFRVSPEERAVFELTGPFYVIEETNAGFVIGSDGLTEDDVESWLAAESIDDEGES